MHIKGVVFDIGGVLYNTYQEHMFYDPHRGVIDHYHLDPDRAASAAAAAWSKYAYEATDYSDWKSLERGYWDLFNQLARSNIPETEWDPISDEFAHPISGAKELLKDLANKKFDLLICSNNTEFWWQRERAKTLGPYFKPEKVILSDRIGEKKTGPKALMFKALISAFEHPIENYVYVDDNIANLTTAAALGITGVFFPVDNSAGIPYLRQFLSV